MKSPARLILLMLFCCSTFGSIGQKTPSKASKLRLEALIFPGIYYNHVSIGASLKQGKLEHEISAGTNYQMLFGKSWNLNLNYSLNRYLGDKNFIPIWLRVSNTRRDVGFEEGYHPHTLRYALGSGYGFTYDMGASWAIKFMIGLGAAINLTDAKGPIFTTELNLQNYRKDALYLNQNPFIIPAIKFRTAILF